MIQLSSGPFRQLSYAQSRLHDTLQTNIAQAVVLKCERQLQKQMISFKQVILRASLPYAIG